MLSLRSFLVAFAPVSFAAAQTTLVVPTTHPTIQAAINAALPGDTVLVLPGTYVERIDFLGKSITVRGTAGAAATTINGNQGGSVVTFAANEPPTATLEGFTITNGLGVLQFAAILPQAAAGGIMCVNASPTIRRCVVRGNQGGTGSLATPSIPVGGIGGPGGILARGSALRLIECEVIDNVGGRGGMSSLGVAGASGGRGGPGGAYLGFTAAGSTPEILRCRFAGNRGGDGGALVFVPVGTAGRGGEGGIEVYTNVPLRLSHCVFHGNLGGNGATPAANGGSGGHGAFDFASNSFTPPAVLMSNCVVTGNTAGNGTGVTNAIGGDGAGSVGAIAFTALSTTIAGNTSGTPLAPGAVTGGLEVGGWMVSSASLRNCILWGNTRAGAPSDLYVNGIAAAVNTCDIGTTTGTTFGAGNVSVDPLFASLAAGDVHLAAASPCRHAGSAVANLPLFDLDGDPRTVGPATDMGADEWDGLVGSREDFVLDLAVNGTYAPAVVTSTAGAGDVVAVRVQSPGGSFANDFALVGLEPWLPPLQPSGPALLPELHLSSSASVLVFLGGGVGSTGVTLATALPPGLSGFALRLQAFSLTGAAKNGAFAATAARDLIL